MDRRQSESTVMAMQPALIVLVAYFLQVIPARPRSEQVITIPCYRAIWCISLPLVIRLDLF